jgi:hypothetical protein
VAQGFYKVTDGTVIMKDEHGEALLTTTRDSGSRCALSRAGMPLLCPSG